ncbi:glycosyltransferase family A protein [Heyndrickxia sporothermodurans]|uniref:glycosyltransferase family A protein n=1 Tax=Heyndrickxia sporothermodurans TaxID=46224 RepID=UPI002E23C3BC|nr:glycosyltransferase family A protein [Heyndrickxia sporothermodurans]MED3696919.1 glycosyltransferase family A protein [Heyndrickxia sporothermodurans]
MNLEVLVSTMHQSDYSILDRMNIHSDAIIINQCDENQYKELDYNGNSIRFLSFNERGVGLSRNNALMRATADICLFADDDVTYVDNYKEIICEAFKKLPDADIILFNVPSTNPNRPYPNITKQTRIKWFNCLKYGAVRMAIKTESIKRSNIYFSLLFGGGARYSSGEDSLFISECIKRGLKVYGLPIEIGKVSQESSSWFNGYTDKYFIDRGILYAFLSKRWSTLLCIQFIIRHRKKFEKSKSWKEALVLMLKGKKDLKKNNQTK